MAVATAGKVELPPASPPDGPGGLRKQLLDILERSAFTAVQALAAVYLAKGVLTISGAEVAILTAVAGALSALRALLSQRIGNGTKPSDWIEDLSSRTAFTFATTLVASLITAAATPLDMPALKSALIAALAASLATVKAAAARGLNNPNNASAIPGA